MKSATNYPVKTIATGFVVLILFSISLFWIRFICHTNLFEMMPNDCKSAAITPSGLLPKEIENDPNVIIHSQVSATLNTTKPLFFGISDYFMERYPRKYSYILLHTYEEDEIIYFDKETGLIVCHYSFYEKLPDNSKLKKMIQFYAGPDGISETPDQNLGRFEGITAQLRAFDLKEDQMPEMIIYDKKIRRFFKIDIKNKTITKGPDLEQGDPHNPIRIHYLFKNSFYIKDFRFESPYIDSRKRTSENTREPYLADNIPSGYPSPLMPREAFTANGPYMLVLDETGRIDLLDRTTLKFIGSAGEIPRPETYFSTRWPPKVRPKDLLGYCVQPLFYENTEDANSANSTFEYLGMYAASVSRDGTALALEIFDKKGDRIATKHTEVTEPNHRFRYVKDIPSSKAVYFEAKWSSTLTTILFIAENLHPPILSIASIFSASSFEAGAGHRALFLLPNSFVAMIFRDMEGNVIERLSTALSLIIPAILLAIILTWRISKDAFVVGLTKKERLAWIISTLVFGLAAYITFKLTKPKIKLVTCRNCGQPRRPDMEKCHRCKSGWHVPELTPPNWRVLGVVPGTPNGEN